MNDPFDLERFVLAQRAVYAQVEAELRAGRKESHWMWFVFPQLRGLGHSATAQKYALASREEARAYLEHEILGPRLRQCTRLVNAVPGRSIEDIFGYPDYMKFHSSMTLFAQAAEDNRPFLDALSKYFGSEWDRATMALLSASRSIA